MRFFCVLFASLVSLGVVHQAAAQTPPPPSNIFVDVSAPSICAITPPDQPCLQSMQPVKLDAIILLTERKTRKLYFINTLSSVDDLFLPAGTYDMQLMSHSQMNGWSASSYNVSPRTIQVDTLPNGLLSQFLVRVQISRKATMEREKIIWIDDPIRRPSALAAH